MRHSGSNVAVRTSAAAAALAVTATMAAGCTAETLSQGDVVEVADAGEMRGETAEVVLPTGTASLTVGAPLERLPDAADPAADGKGLDASSEVIPIAVRFDSGEVPLSPAMAADPKPASLSVEAGGQQADLGSLYDVIGAGRGREADATHYLVVPEGTEPSEARLTVHHGGRSFVAHSDGSVTGKGAQEMRDLIGKDFRTLACPSPRWPAAKGLALTVWCEGLSYANAPYWPGKGWSDATQGWRVFRVDRLAVTGITQDDGARYRVQSMKARIGGSALPQGAESDEAAGVVAAGPTRGPGVPISVRVEGALDAGQGPGLVQTSARRVVELPE